MPRLNDIKKGKDIGIKGYSDRFIWLACPQCRRERWVSRNHAKSARYTSLCSQCNRKIGYTSFKRERHWNWKGGYGHTVDGYVLVRLEEEDFFYPMAQKDHKVREHRLVMAQYLKRCLLPWEVIHHKNGIRDDNRLENLELLPHARFHLIDSMTKAYIGKLEAKIKRLEAKLKQDILYKEE